MLCYACFPALPFLLDLPASSVQYGAIPECLTSASKTFSSTCHSETNQRLPKLKPPGPKWNPASHGSSDSGSVRDVYASLVSTSSYLRE